jgi:uncharacterized protein
MKHLFLIATFLALCAARTFARSSLTPATAPGAKTCGVETFLTFEQGKLAAVDWVENKATQVHTRMIVNQAQVVDATIDLRPDGTASHSSVLLSVAGGQATKPQVRDLGEGAIYWSPRITSSIEQAIARARVLNQPSAKLRAASLYSDARTEVSVDRVNPADWVVTYQDKKYLVITDEQGCMLAATMPEYGVVIERRPQFSGAQYPLWPPYSAPPDGAYRAIDVSIPAAQGVALAGTLTLPLRKHGSLPAAVLITGISKHERNNGDAPWMPFRDIADALSRAGIVVLRVDDRGVGKSSGDQSTWTTPDKADDVRAEVTWLRARPGIDPKRIALIGYSEGGLIAPMVAGGDPSIAAVITLAGPGVSGHDVAEYQVAQPILRDPMIADADKEKEIAKQLADALKDLSPHESSYMSIDPLQYDRQVRCPALVIQGGADATVPVRSAERIATAMRSAGNTDVTVGIFPGVSHSLLPDPGGLSSDWASLPGFLVAPPLLNELMTWSIAKLKP